MNHYTFDEIELGKEVSFQYEIDDAKMSKFLEITGDKNPLHNDLEYAKNVGYPEKVVYGMLTSSILSTLAGMYLPGEYSLIHSVEINFVNPVFLSKCPLTVNAKVVSKDDRFQIITLKYYIVDQSFTKVCRGTMTIGFTSYHKFREK